MKKEPATPNKPEEVKKQPVELTDEEMDKVTGAGDPFKDVPRVPNQPIDPELREDA